MTTIHIYIYILVFFLLLFYSNNKKYIYIDILSSANSSYQESTEMVESPVEADFGGAHEVLTWLTEGDDVAVDHKRRYPLRHPNLLHLQLIQPLHVLLHMHQVPHHPYPSGLEHPHHLPHHPHPLRRRRRRLLPELLPHRVHERRRHHHVEVVVAERKRPRISRPENFFFFQINYTVLFHISGEERS